MAMPERAIIHVDTLSAGYENSHILFDVNFEAKEKQVTIVIGPNGSGKSTLIKSIFGLNTTYSGKITLQGKDITGFVPHKVAREKIAYMPQVNNVFANLTIKENLIMAGYTVDPSTVQERMPGIFEAFPVLKKYENTKADTLSGGERQMLGMGMALIRKPTVMMFDEPTAGLSPKLAHEVLDKIKQLKEDFGITIVLVEQNVRRALKFGDWVYLLAGGKNVFSGTPKDLLSQPELGKLYLGIS